MSRKRRTTADKSARNRGDGPADSKAGGAGKKPSGQGQSGRGKGQGKGGSAKRGRRRKPPRKGPVTRTDPSDTEDADVRFVQPYEATKAYLCPGCRGDIPPGMGHMVVVPPDAPDLRRHWHRGCWVNRRNRR